MTPDVTTISGVVLLAESTVLPGGDGTIDDLLRAVGAAIDGGVRTVIVRDKHRPVGERRTLVAGVRDGLDSVGGTVLIAHDDAAADLLGADGVHLSARDGWGRARAARCDEGATRAGSTGNPRHSPYPRRFQAPTVTFGCSAHDAAEIEAAASAGADYVTVSPVYPTASKPGYGPPLGPDGLAALVAHSPVPVIALGGITTPGQVIECMTAGAVGVAVMGAVLRSPDPESVSAALVAALSVEV